ncbi:hypothetical protein ACIP3U_34540 [[Kitasatospora] papulosa]|uniref:hypothetical protein n=1 Tax=[Kitasatospora] papulosa TaxID=1464011 RepID=UPI0037F1DFEA
MSRLLAKPKCPRRAKRRPRPQQARRDEARAADQERAKRERTAAAAADAVRQTLACEDCGLEQTAGQCEACSYRRRTEALIAEAGMVVATWSADLTDQDVVAAQRPGAPTRPSRTAAGSATTRTARTPSPPRLRPPTPPGNVLPNTCSRRLKQLHDQAAAARAASWTGRLPEFAACPLDGHVGAVIA